MTDEHGLLIVLSGPPGEGKTTIAGQLAQHYGKAVHLHTDDFWPCIVTGGIAPCEPEAHTQNHVVLGVVAGAAFAYAAGASPPSSTAPSDRGCFTTSSTGQHNIRISCCTTSC